MNAFFHCANFVHLLAFYVLIYDILKKKNCSGISGKTQLLYATVFITRYTDLLTVFHSLYNTSVKIYFIVLTLVIIYLIYSKYKDSYDKDQDSFWNIGLLIPALVLALLLNYFTLGYINVYDIQEILWTFSIYLEALAIIPQYHLFMQSGEGRRLLPYVSTLCTYRGLYICNWIYRYQVENHVDPISWGAGSVQTLILAVMIVHILMHKQRTPKWQEITKVFTIEASKEEGQAKSPLYKIDIEPSKESLLLNN